MTTIHRRQLFIARKFKFHKSKALVTRSRRRKNSVATRVYRMRDTIALAIHHSFRKPVAQKNKKLAEKRHTRKSKSRRKTIPGRVRVRFPWRARAPGENVNALLRRVVSSSRLSKIRARRTSTYMLSIWSRERKKLDSTRLFAKVRASGKSGIAARGRLCVGL